MLKTFIDLKNYEKLEAIIEKNKPGKTLVCFDEEDRCLQPDALARHLSQKTGLQVTIVKPPPQTAVLLVAHEKSNSDPRK